MNNSHLKLLVDSYAGRLVVEGSPLWIATVNRIWSDFKSRDYEPIALLALRVVSLFKTSNETIAVFRELIAEHKLLEQEWA